MEHGNLSGCTLPLKINLNLTFFFVVNKLKDYTVDVSEAEVAGVFVNNKSQNKNSKFGFTQLVIKNVQHVR